MYSSVTSVRTTGIQYEPAAARGKREQPRGRGGRRVTGGAQGELVHIQEDGFEALGNPLVRRPEQIRVREIGVTPDLVQTKLPRLLGFPFEVLTALVDAAQPLPNLLNCHLRHHWLIAGPVGAIYHVYAS